MRTSITIAIAVILTTGCARQPVAESTWDGGTATQDPTGRQGQAYTAPTYYTVTGFQPITMTNKSNSVCGFVGLVTQDATGMDGRINIDSNGNYLLTGSVDTTAMCVPQSNFTAAHWLGVVGPVAEFSAFPEPSYHDDNLGYPMDWPNATGCWLADYYGGYDSNCCTFTSVYWNGDTRRWHNYYESTDQLVKDGFICLRGGQSSNYPEFGTFGPVGVNLGSIPISGASLGPCFITSLLQGFDGAAGVTVTVSQPQGQLDGTLSISGGTTAAAFVTCLNY